MLDTKTTEPPPLACMWGAHSEIGNVYISYNDPGELIDSCKQGGGTLFC